jgi:HK97 family phage portal protein
MGIFDLFRRNQPQVPAIKESAASKLLMVNPGQAVWSPRNYESFAKEAYGKNVVAYQAINRVADAVASVKLGVYRGETELTEHPLKALLNRPNPFQSYGDYMRAKVSFILIAGNGYEERFRVGGDIKELYQLRPDRMKIIPSANGIPAAYEYSMGQNKTRWDVDPRTLDSDVRHLKLFNPLNDWYGMSPIEAGSYAIDQNNESMNWMQSLLQNSARPSGALTVKDGGTLSDENFNRLKAQIEEQYSGSSNAGRPMLLEGGLDWQQMGLSPTDMGIIESKFSSARDVALAFGVPPQLLGIPGDNTYSNYAEARLAFWEDTALPLLDMIVHDWNAWLGAAYGVDIKADIDSIPAIAEKRLSMWQMADQSQDLTINERRALKGYGPIEGGDVLFVSSAMIPLSMASEPILPPEPSAVSPELIKAMVYGPKAD